MTTPARKASDRPARQGSGGQDQEGYISLLEGAAELSPPAGTLSFPVAETGPAAQQPFSAVAVPATIPAKLPAQPGDDPDWAADPIPAKFNKIREAVLNAKTASEVQAAAGCMPVREWLDWVVKLAPKQPDAPSVKITAIRVELPPARSGEGVAEVVVELPGQMAEGLD